MGFKTITNGQKVSSWRNNINNNLYELYNLYIPLSATSMTWDILGRVNFLTYTEIKTSTTISSGILTLNFKQGSLFTVSINQNISLITISNVPPIDRLVTLTLVTIGNGTQYAFGAMPNILWEKGIIPTITSTLNKVDIYKLRSHDGGSTWTCSRIGKNFN